jgi:hypothetical protein
MVTDFKKERQMVTPQDYKIKPSEGQKRKLVTP